MEVGMWGYFARQSSPDGKGDVVCSPFWLYEKAIEAGLPTECDGQCKTTLESLCFALTNQEKGTVFLCDGSNTRCKTMIAGLNKILETVAQATVRVNPKSKPS